MDIVMWMLAGGVIASVMLASAAACLAAANMIYDRFGV